MSLGSAVDTAITPAQELLDLLGAGYGPRDHAFRYWDGTVVGPDDADARFTLALHHPGAVRRMLWPFNPCAFGEAYIYGDIDIEGDIAAAFDLLMHWGQTPRSLWRKLDLLRRILALPSEGRARADRGAHLSGGLHSEARDRKAIEYHYEKPTEFYALFLGRRLQYTCAYFASADEDIDTAQERKLEHICRKLRLRPGERLIDFGCGWGGLIIYAAKQHGVHATGVTVCQEQAKWAEREIDRLGLGDRCKILFMDYRQVPETQSYDKAVSVGFIEHLGRRMMPTYLGKVWRLLRPGGLYLNHGITFKPFTPYPPWRAFTLKYIFPDAELVPIADTIDMLCRAGFEVHDVESLREHYALTLDCWRHGLEKQHAEAARVTDEVTYRIYRLFFTGAAHGFRTGLYNLYQALVSKPGGSGAAVPLTRADLYR